MEKKKHTTATTADINKHCCTFDVKLQPPFVSKGFESACQLMQTWLIGFGSDVVLKKWSDFRSLGIIGSIAFEILRCDTEK